jgi:hypothetical protein
MWRELVAWCQVTQEEFTSEALSLFFYDTEENAWSYWIPPQETAGMTVSTDPDDPRYEKEREAYPDLQFGTLHHHCSTSAFQSGTDLSDEEDRDGLHFTIGKLGSAKLDVHARFCIEGSSHVIDAEDVVEAPKWLQDIPAKYQTGILKDLLASPEEDLEQWQEFFKDHLKKVSKVAYNSNRNFQNQRYYTEHHGNRGYWEKGVFIVANGKTNHKALGTAANLWGKKK